MSVSGLDGLAIVENLCGLRVEACRPPHVPVPKPGPCKGWKTPEFKQAQARARQKNIDDARSKAGVLAELEELVTDEVDGDVLERTMTRVTRTAGLGDDEQIKALVDVAQRGERRELDRAIGQQARRFRLRRIGGNARTARFDAKDHEMISGERRPAAGTPVEIVRPGYDFLLDGKPVRLHKAIVQVA